MNLNNNVKDNPFTIPTKRNCSIKSITIIALNSSYVTNRNIVVLLNT